MPDMGETVAGILAAAAIIAALVVIGRCVAWLTSVLRRLARLIDALLGEPKGSPGYPDGRPGVLERLDATVGDVREVKAEMQQTTALLHDALARLAAVEAQLVSNGGHTLRDAVDRLAPPPDGATAATTPREVTA